MLLFLSIPWLAHAAHPPIQCSINHLIRCEHFDPIHFNKWIPSDYFYMIHLSTQIFHTRSVWSFVLSLFNSHVHSPGQIWVLRSIWPVWVVHIVICLVRCVVGFWLFLPNDSFTVYDSYIYIFFPQGIYFCTIHLPLWSNTESVKLHVSVPCFLMSRRLLMQSASHSSCWSGAQCSCSHQRQ